MKKPMHMRNCLMLSAAGAMLLAGVTTGCDAEAPLAPHQAQQGLNSTEHVRTQEDLRATIDQSESDAPPANGDSYPAHGIHVAFDADRAQFEYDGELPAHVQEHRSTTVTGDSARLVWNLDANKLNIDLGHYRAVALKIQPSTGAAVSQRLDASETLALEGSFADGGYNWEIVLEPAVSEETQAAMREIRAESDPALAAERIAELRRQGALPTIEESHRNRLSGYFTLLNGAVVSSAQEGN